MKLLLVGDVHLRFKAPVNRKDNFFEAQSRKFRWILDKALKEDALILQAGDFWNNPRPGYFLIQYYVQELRKYKEKSGKPLYSIFGQHDTFLYSERSRNATAMAILESGNLIEILNEIPYNIGEEIDVYGCSYGAKIPKVQDKNKFNILVIHKMLIEEKLWPGQQDQYAQPFLKIHPEYNLIISGDNHQDFMVSVGKGRKRMLFNPGCIVRQTIAEKERIPKVVLFDTATLEFSWVLLPHEMNVFKESEEREEVSFEEFIGELKAVEGSKSIDLIENLQVYLAENKVSPQVVDILSEVLNQTITVKEE